jgi:hypothetical protein
MGIRYAHSEPGSDLGVAVEKLSYLTTFVALIYGLGIANCLAHLSSLIKRGRGADWYWVHTLWAIYLMLLMASLWWALLNWTQVPRIDYFSYLSLLLAPAFLFVASDLLFPERHEAGSIDLKAHFFTIKRQLFLVLFAALLADELDSSLKGWEHIVALGPYYWGTQAYWAVACFVGYRSNNERVQGAIVIGIIALLLVGMSHILKFA